MQSPNVRRGTGPSRDLTFGRGGSTWAEVRSIIMERISDGTYPTGTLIPTEKELATEFGCARATVNRALGSLSERGVLERRRRIGTRVALNPGSIKSPFSLPVLRDAVEATGQAFHFEYLGKTNRPAPVEIQARLFRSDPNDLIETATLFSVDDRLVCAERRWHDRSALPCLLPAMDSTMTGNEWLAANITISLLEQHVSAHTAGGVDVATLLKCAPAAPVLVYESCVWVSASPASFTRHIFLPGEAMSTKIVVA